MLVLHTGDGDDGKFAPCGVIADVVRVAPRDSAHGAAAVALGRQRGRLLSVRRDAGGTVADVEVSKETTTPLPAYIHASHFAPALWRRFDADWLSDHLWAREAVRRLVAPALDAAPVAAPAGAPEPSWRTVWGGSAGAFAFALARSLPLLEGDRVRLLAADAPAPRLTLLRRALDAAPDGLPLACVACGAAVARARDADASLGAAGVASPLFVNPAGVLFRVLLVREGGVPGLQLFGHAAVLVDSWFAGYGWTMAGCGRCGTHVGWRFDWLGAASMRADGRPALRVRWDAGARLMRCAPPVGTGGRAASGPSAAEWEPLRAAAPPPPAGVSTFYGLRHDAVELVQPPAETDAGSDVGEDDRVDS